MPEQPTKSDRATDFILTAIYLTCINYFLVHKYVDFTRSLLVGATSALFLAFFRQKIKDRIKKGLKKIRLRKMKS